MSGRGDVRLRWACEAGSAPEPAYASTSVIWTVDPTGGHRAAEQSPGGGFHRAGQQGGEVERRAPVT